MALVSCALAHGVRGDALPDGAELYLEECSRCHGQIAGPQASARNPLALRVATLDAPPMAFALPYGPSLAGVIGRSAGSVPGYDYSKAFLRAMRSVVWSTATLDEYMTDSQLRAPGALMYYAQPDAAVRRRIISYLATTRAGSRRYAPIRGDSAGKERHPGRALAHVDLLLNLRR